MWNGLLNNDYNKSLTTIKANSRIPLKMTTDMIINSIDISY